MSHQFWKKTIALALAAVLAAGGAQLDRAGTSAAETERTGEWKELPGTTSTMSSFDPSFLSVTGFAKGAVHDRTDAINTERYRVVKTEEEFLKALADAKTDIVDVIEIAADLDLGWDALSEEAKRYGVVSQYGWDMRGTITNPSILASGVSQLTISDTKGLTIFSQAGNTVKHAEWKLQGSSSDIVIRNLTIDEMWMYNDEKEGDTKSGGWTLMKLNGVKGVWIDHCTFTLGYDGNMDSENGASDMTASWCKFSLEADEDPDKNSMIYKTVTYMEELYQSGQLGSDSVYASLRETAGGDLGKIMAYEAYHTKFNLNGSGDKDFKDGRDQQDGNQRLHLTMAYNKVNNITVRFPLIRQGTAHYFNCVLDNSGHKKIAEELGKEYDTVAISARDGACVGADTCVYREVKTVVDCEERQTSSAEHSNAFGIDEEWRYAFAGVKSHVLVVNSTVETDGETYTGSSWDNQGENLFTRNYKWNDGKTSIGNFQWFSHLVDEDKYTRGEAPKDENGNYTSFTMTYDNKLTYDYQVLPLAQVEKTVDTYGGAYTLREKPEFWLRTAYDPSEKILTAKEKNEKVPVEDLKLNVGEEIHVSVGSPLQISADVVPSHADNKELTWTSSDPDIVEVKDSGLVAARKTGTAVITVTTKGTDKDGGVISRSFTVNTDTPVQKIIIENAPAQIYLGDETTPAEQVQLQAKVIPSHADNPAVVWSSRNASALQVGEDGLLTPLKRAGNVRITCTSVSDPSVFATVTISVKEGVRPADTNTPEPSLEPSDAPVPSVEPSDAPVPSVEPSETPKPSDTPVPSSGPSESPKPVLYGDVNEDGSVTATDALLVLQKTVKLTDLTEREAKAANVNGDKEINTDDALLILQKAVKLIRKFSVE